MHLLWQTLAISNCSAYVKFFNSSGIFPTQRSFARAKVGIFFFSRDSTHMGHTLLQLCAKMGPLNPFIGSELLPLAFLVTPSTFSKLTFSPSESSSISQIGVNFPQTAQPASSNISGEVSAQKPDITLWKVDLVETSHFSWTNSVYAMICCETLDIQTLKNEAYHTQHVFPYFYDTMFVDTQNWKLLYRV